MDTKYYTHTKFIHFNKSFYAEKNITCETALSVCTDKDCTANSPQLFF